MGSNGGKKPSNIYGNIEPLLMRIFENAYKYFDDQFSKKLFYLLFVISVLSTAKCVINLSQIVSL